MDSRSDFSPHVSHSIPLLLEKGKGLRVEEDIEPSEEIQPLEEAEPQHSVLTEDLGRLPTAISPFEKLPSEVLSHIFSSSAQIEPHDRCPSQTDLLTFPYMRSYTPWAIRQTCAWWRLLVQRDHSLWTHFRITLPEEPSPRWKTGPLEAWDTLLDSIESCLPIPETSSVYVYLDLSPVSYRDSIEFVCMYVFIEGMQVALGNRLKAISIIGDGHGFEPLLQFFPLSLESLTLHHLRDPKRHHTVAFPGDLGRSVCHAKSLHTLQIMGNHEMPYDGSFLRHLPWANLHEICLDYIVSHRNTTLNFLRVISRSERVTRATLSVLQYGKHAWDRGGFTDDSPTSEGDVDVGEFIPRNPRCSLPCLTSLSIRIHEEYTRIYDYLTLPKLSHLCIIHGTPEGQSPVLERVTAMLQRSGCKLRSFTDNPIQADLDSEKNARIEDEDTIEEFLNCISSTVEELHTCVLPSEAILEKIGSGALLPKLQSFRFYTEDDPCGIPELLKPRLGWLDSRDCHYSGLRRVRIFPRGWATLKDTPIKTVAEGVRDELEKRYPTLELYFGPKDISSWQDTRI